MPGVMTSELCLHLRGMHHARPSLQLIYTFMASINCSGLQSVITLDAIIKTSRSEIRSFVVVFS